MKQDRQKMNENEELIYRSIQNDPYISQQELAEIVGLSRPAVANLISGLMRKGWILGKGYILNEENRIICIGGANVDRKFYLKEAVQLGTSNPVHSTQGAGGVARNVAENLGRLGRKTVLMTVAGMDTDWEAIKRASERHMDLDYVATFSGMATGSYTAVLEENGNLHVALADMDAYDELTSEVLAKNEALLVNAGAMVADLNCPQETICYLKAVSNEAGVPLIIVPVSSPKMQRLPEDLDGVSWLICNRDESETYLKMKIETEEDWKLAVQKWLDFGIQNVVVTNGKDGAIAGNAEEGILYEPAIVVSDIKDVTGAGDAFCSAVIHAWLSGRNLRDIVRAGSINAAKTLMSKSTVRQDLSAAKLKQELEELK